MKIPKCSSSPRKKPTPLPVIDQLAALADSRRKEREEMVKAGQQLDKMRLEFQRRILASRAKFHAARWKMINKSMDD